MNCLALNCLALGLCAPFTTVSPAYSQVAPPGAVRINSNFNISQSVKAGDINAIDTAEEAGRKIMYQRAGQECKLLLEALASTCKLELLNVYTNVQSRQFRGDSGNIDVNTTGNAQFWITTKN